MSVAVHIIFSVDVNLIPSRVNHEYVFLREDRAKIKPVNENNQCLTFELIHDSDIVQ